MEEILKRLERLDYLIRIKGTGTPANLAHRLGVSERCIYSYIQLMKERGAPIKFSKDRKSYYYEKDGIFDVCISWKQKDA